MVSLLDRYLLKRAGAAYAAIIVVLVLVIIALDITNKVGVAMQREHGVRLVALRYLMQSPEWAVSVSAPALLIAALAVCAPMLRRGEFVALSAGGMGVRRATRALLALAVVVGLLTAALSDAVVPPCSARVELIDDVLAQQKRDGKTWEVIETGTRWFVAHALVRGEQRIELTGVAIAPASGGLVTGDRLEWNGGTWRLVGDLRRFEILPDGRYRHSAPESIELTGDLALPYDPTRLHRALLPASVLTGYELMQRGGRQNRAVVYGRWSQAFAPLLALLAALPLFVRFAHKDHLIVACIRAAAIAAVPLVIIGLSGLVADTVRWDPIVVSLAAIAVAALPGIWLWTRWRL